MTTLDIDKIMEVLPHRYPMLMVDKIIECDGERRIVGIKNVTVNEPFFQGHFPGVPVMPGVLQLEAMAQTAGVMLSQKGGFEGKIPYFMSIDKAKFRKVIKPGDQMRIEVEFLSLRSKTGKVKGRIFVGDALASEAELMCMITDRKTDG